MDRSANFSALLGFVCLFSIALASAQSATDGFSSLLGNVIIERIKAGKAVKASVEDVQKISFQQELACNDCGNLPASVTVATTPYQAVTTTTSLPGFPLINIGSSGVIVPCPKVGDIVPGPQFILPSPQSDFDVKLDVVNASSADTNGSTPYLSYNPVTGLVKIGPNKPQIDVTQIYSAVLINRKTLERSNPLFFTAVIYTCVIQISGPKSFTVCIGLGTPYLGSYTGLNYTVQNVGLLAAGPNWNTVNPLTGAEIIPLPGPGNSFCPFVTAFTGPGDLGQCYIFDRQTGNPEFFARGNQQSQCVFDRCITPAFGSFKIPTIYTQVQLDAFAASVSLPANTFLVAGGGTLDPGCTGNPPPKGLSFCNTCLAFPASVVTGAAAVTPCGTGDTFTQTITIDGTAPSFQTGIISGITVSYDSTCSSLAAFNVTY
ncbi:hypothetical protein BV898_14128 [Hypsibius exemplaris]|uniref:Uncharacterized protein n=1 Tax=Hypsibius exemplaris TaxID=2072580 RepID=A0A1W0W8R6_HYPEX|nr:hypothetical protein BV898_14128 [Hypsibius exemplaris]